MSTVNLILINTVIITQSGQAAPIQAGQLVTSSTIAAACEAEGGVLGPATDPNLVAAAAVVAKLRAKGRNESECTQVMMAAYASTPYETGIQEAELSFTFTQVAALGASLTGVLDFAAALPAGARFVGVEMDVTVDFAGCATLTAKLGDGTTVDRFMGAETLKTLGLSGAAGTATYVGQSCGGVTPVVTFTATTNDLSALTAGAANIKLLYLPGEP